MSEPVSYERLMEIAKLALGAHIYDLKYCIDNGYETFGSWEDALKDSIAWAEEIGMDVDEVMAEYGRDFDGFGGKNFLLNKDGGKIRPGDRVRHIDLSEKVMLTPPGADDDDPYDEYPGDTVFLVYEIYPSYGWMILEYSATRRYLFVDPAHFETVTGFVESALGEAIFPGNVVRLHNPAQYDQPVVFTDTYGDRPSYYHDDVFLVKSVEPERNAMTVQRSGRTYLNVGASKFSLARKDTE